MSETQAFIVLFAGMAVFVGIASVVLALAHASGAVYGLTFGLGVALGGWIVGCIVVHYAQIERRKKREEIILSR